MHGATGADSRAIAPAFAGHGEISVAAGAPGRASISIVTVAVTMPPRLKHHLAKPPIAKVTILGKLDLLKFDENLHRKRVNIGQNARFIANDSFKPVC